MATHHNGGIDCKASLEDIGDGRYLVNIKASNGDHIELTASGKNHAADRLRQFAERAGYNILNAEGVPAHWKMGAA